MSRVTRRSRAAAIVVVSAIVAQAAGCATPLEPDSMVPDMPRAALRQTARTLTVAPVTSEERPTSWGSLTLDSEFAIENEPFQQALVEAIDQSRIFQKVDTSGPADYELRAHIVSQQTQLSGWAATTSSLMVNYQLRDTAGNREVWHDTIISRGTAENSRPGASSARRSLAAAARRNVLEMLARLSEQIP